MNKGLLVVISGPSGAGKGSICKELVKTVEGIELSVSATTRAPRVGEVEGVNYFFKTENEFQKMKIEGDFLEYAHVYSNYYGTPKSFVEKKLSQGIDVILEIDIQGAMQVRHSFPEAILVFIMPPSMEELQKRIELRGTETEKSKEERMNSTKREVDKVINYDYCIINDDLHSAIKKVQAVILAERHSVKRNYIKDLIQEFKEGKIVTAINR